MEADTVEINVKDNGGGTPAVNLRKIFQHGFTTHSDGHGFGLQGPAIAATQMHGTLSVASDGPERGATFTLRLPIRPAIGQDAARDEFEETSCITTKTPEENTA